MKHAHIILSYPNTNRAAMVKVRARIDMPTPTMDRMLRVLTTLGTMGSFVALDSTKQA